jgi:glycolate oxidase FAD binding subunit
VAAVGPDDGAAGRSRRRTRWSNGAGALRWQVADERTDPNACARGRGITAGTRRCFARPTSAPGRSIHVDVMTELHRRLKAVFDPAGIFNRGRLYPAF